MDKNSIIRAFHEYYKAGNVRIPRAQGDFRYFEPGPITTQGGFKFEFFKDPREAQEALDCALQGIQSLQQYISNTDYIADNELTPEIEIQFPASVQDLNTPRLDSFYRDKRVIVKPIKKIHLKYEVQGMVHFTESKYPVIFGVEDPATINLRRGYGVDYTDVGPGEPKEIEDFETMINVQRYPLTLNCAYRPGNVQRFSALAYDVLLNQLEPLTSFRLLKDELDCEEEETWAFNANASNRKYEEEVIACGVLLGWLYDVHSDEQRPKDYTDFLIKKRFFEAATLGKEQTYNSLSQVFEKGPEEVIEFYANPEEWDIDRFLNGDF